MGTRNLTVVFHDGEYKVSKYCQWDGDPSGQGATILDFLTNKFDRAKFIENLNKCYSDEEKLQQMWLKAGSDPETGMIDVRLADAFTNEHPQLGRNMGGDVLEFIQNSTDDSIMIPFDIEFAKNGLMCEWCYVINLDDNLFEIYSGFHKESTDIDTRFGTEPNENGYLPVQLEKVYSLSALPTLHQLWQGVAEKYEDEDDEPATSADDQVNPQVLVEKTHDFFQVAIEQSGHPGLAKLISDFMEYSMDEFLEFVENKNDETT